MKKFYRPPFLQFAIFLGILCTAMLTFLIAHKLLKQSEMQILALQKIVQDATRNDLCHKGSLQSAILLLQQETKSLAVQIESVQKNTNAYVWHTAWQVEIPHNTHWALWLESAAQKIPAATHFSTCTWQADVRLLQCRATLYRMECPE